MTTMALGTGITIPAGIFMRYVECGKGWEGWTGSDNTWEGKHGRLYKKSSCEMILTDVG